MKPVHGVFRPDTLTQQEGSRLSTRCFLSPLGVREVIRLHRPNSYITHTVGHVQSFQMIFAIANCHHHQWEARSGEPNEIGVSRYAIGRWCTNSADLLWSLDSVKCKSLTAHSIWKKQKNMMVLTSLISEFNLKNQLYISRMHAGSHMKGDCCFKAKQRSSVCRSMREMI